MAKTAYVAFGGNLGDSRKSILDAYEALALVPGIETEALSDIIETKPWGYEEQDNFCNACARLRVDISPRRVSRYRGGYGTKEGNQKRPPCYRYRCNNI